MVDHSFHDYVIHDLFVHIPGITSRAMFGGWGIYKDRIIFGIIVEGELYFKVDESNKANFKEYGSHPFVYESKGKSVEMGYWNVPEEVMGDSEKLKEWVDVSVQVSERKVAKNK